jgi:hypothetical protein
MHSMYHYALLITTTGTYFFIPSQFLRETSEKNGTLVISA